VLLLGIKHQQQTQADCLVVCAQMLLTYLGIDVALDDLTRRLGTTDWGTPFTNISRLEALGVLVEVGKYGDLLRIEQALETGLPVIVAVKTSWWQTGQVISTDHAVIVVGIDQRSGMIYLDDPYAVDAPLELPLIEFEASWIERDEAYAIIRLAPP
jgi:ABC-type bacteriocin/lantibiotic exporter with double-glycine peptidase domain